MENNKLKIIIDERGEPCSLKEFWINIYKHGFGKCWPDIYWAEQSIKTSKVLYRIHVRLK